MSRDTPPEHEPSPTSTTDGPIDADAAESAPPAPGKWSWGAFREVWTIAFPTVLTMTSYTVMQFVDKLMVGQVGPVEVAAQGNGGIWSFNLIAFVMGVVTVVNTFVAQNLGAGTPERGPRYAWSGAWIALVAWLVLLLPYACVLPRLFAWMGHEGQLLALESIYARIMLSGGILLLLNKTLGHFFFGLHRPLVVTAAAIVGNTCNVLLNYALIFGSEGLPELGLPGVPGVPALGLVGAAVATVIGTAIELAIPLAVFLGPRLNRQLRTRAAWRPRWTPIRELLAIGWPGAVQMGNEIVCWSIFMTVLVGGFGPDHMTAGWITLGYMHLSFMPAVGMSVATSAVVGRHIGAGRPDVARDRVHLAMTITVVYCGLCGLAFVLFRHDLIAVFIGGDVAPEQAARIIAIGSGLLICAAVFQAFDALGIVYMGALRGAGDTVWPGVVTLLFSWVVIVGGGWAITETAPGLESLGPWIAAAIYIVVLGVTLALRFESGRWRSIELLQRRPEARRAAAVAPIGLMPTGSEADAEIEDIAPGLAGLDGSPSVETTPDER